MLTREWVMAECQRAAQEGLTQLRVEAGEEVPPGLAESLRAEGLSCWTASTMTGPGRLESLWVWWTAG